MYIFILTTAAYIVWRASRLKHQNGDTELTKIITAATTFFDKTKRIAMQVLTSYLEVIQWGLNKIPGNYNNFSSNEMSQEEARQILVVTPTSSKEEIANAFKRLMMVNHPDKGGTEYLADRIIKAKSILIARIKD